MKLHAVVLLVAAVSAVVTLPVENDNDVAGVQVRSVRSADVQYRNRYPGQFGGYYGGFGFGAPPIGYNRYRSGSGQPGNNYFWIRPRETVNEPLFGFNIYGGPSNVYSRYRM